MGSQRVGHDWASNTFTSVWKPYMYIGASLVSYGSADKELACNVGDLGSIPGLGRSSVEGKGYPLQYSRLENSMDCIDHGITTLSRKVAASLKGRNAAFCFKILLPVFDLRVFRLFQLTCVFNLIFSVVLSHALGSVQPAIYPHPLSLSTNYTPHTKHLHSLHPPFSLTSPAKLATESKSCLTQDSSSHLDSGTGMGYR